MNKDQEIQELQAMIQADTKHLQKALANGDRVHAHQFVDAIIDNTRALQDLLIF